MKNIIILILVVIVGSLAFSLLQKDEMTSVVKPSDTIVVENSASVVIESPVANSAVSSPLVVQGKARGNWFFEASFPIEIMDEHGAILGMGIAQAQAEWMTTEYVPFTATITFAQATTTRGFILFKKDNPSGLPEHDATIAVPIIFAQ